MLSISKSILNCGGATLNGTLTEGVAASALATISKVDVLASWNFNIS